MALSTFALIQGYLTALVLVIATVLWFRVRREYDVARIRTHKVYNVVLLLTLPFIFRIIRFIPETVNIMLQRFLLLLTFMAFVAVAVKTYRMNTSERTKDLRELLEASKSHPIRLEFARRIIEPEYKKFLEERARVGRESRLLELREKKALDASKRLEEEQQKFKELKDMFAKEKQEARNLELVVKKREQTFKAKEDELNKKIEDCKSERERYAQKQQALKEKEVQQEQDYKTFRDGLLRDNDKKLEEARKRYLEKAKQREESLLTWEREIERYERRVKQREATLKNLDEKSNEVASDYEKLKRLEIKLKGEEIELEAKKTEVRKNTKEFERERDDFLDEKDRIERLYTRAKKMEEGVLRERDRLKKKEEELILLEDKLEKLAKELGVAREVVRPPEQLVQRRDKKPKSIGHVLRLVKKKFGGNHGS